MDDAALAEVIRGAQRGEPQAFDKLVDAYGHRITGFLFRRTGSLHEAEDLVQEVFLRVVRTISAYSHDGRFEAWLFRIAANLARDQVRKARRDPTLRQKGFHGSFGGGVENESLSLDRLPGSVEAAGEGLERAEAIDELNDALALLSDSEREVIMLRHFSQLSFKEIAELTGMPLGTALARSHRALARLREMLNPPAAEQASWQSATTKG